MVALSRCKVGSDTEFVAGRSGPELRVKKSRVEGMCAEPGSHGKVGRYETMMKVVTNAKKFSIEIVRTDWSQSVEGVPDTSTATGRLFAHYGTIRDMPGGNLYKVEVTLSGLEIISHNDSSVVLKLATAPKWFEKPDATFGPFGKTSGKFEGIQPVAKKGNTLQLTFESTGSAQYFVSAIRGSSADAPEAALQPHELEGAAVVFSGMDHSVEVKLKREVERLGGRVVSGISGKTTHLVRGASAGATKLAKAEELNAKKACGIQILDAADFQKVVADCQDASSVKRQRKA